MAKFYISPEVHDMVLQARSFGYLVIIRHPRIWCLCPYKDIVFLAKKLTRRGWWSLFQIDAMMWTTWGAMGKPIKEFIEQTELMQFLYDEAYKQTKKHGGNIKKLKCSRPELYRQRNGNIVTIQDIRSKKHKAAYLEGKVINRKERNSHKKQDG